MAIIVLVAFAAICLPHTPTDLPPEEVEQAICAAQVGDLLVLMDNQGNAEDAIVVRVPVWKDANFLMARSLGADESSEYRIDFLVRKKTRVVRKDSYYLYGKYVSDILSR